MLHSSNGQKRRSFLRQARRIAAQGFEALEARLPLTGGWDSQESQSANWFQQVGSPATAEELSQYGASAQAERWIVSLNPQAVGLIHQPSEATRLLNPPTVLRPDQPWSQVQVLRGLGLAGQLLVEVRASGAVDGGQLLAMNPLVAAASPVGALKGEDTEPNDPEFSNESHLAAIDAPLAWDTTIGEPQVIVAVVDSGIDLTHPDLYQNIWINPGEIPPLLAQQFAALDADQDGQLTMADLNDPSDSRFVTDVNQNHYIDAEDLLADSRWIDHSDNDDNGFMDDLFGWDFVNNDNDPLDDNGHGTHVAGILAAQGNNNIGVTGVAWQTSLLPVKFLNEGNAGDSANAIAATNYITALRTRVAPLDSLAGPVNVRVVNNSWGVSSGTGDVILRNSIAAAGDAGILFVAGAGNGDILGHGIDIDSTPFFPAAYDLDNIISVAASDPNDQLAPFSNFGTSSVDIAAPGINVLSTERGGNYGTRNGTSMATPEVSGVAALVFATHPDAAVSEIKSAILGSADHIDALAPYVGSGGRLNAAAALAAQTFAPQASLTSAEDITAESDEAEELHIHYIDTDALDLSSFDDNDITVTRVGFGSTVYSATLVPPVTSATDNKSADVTYQLLPPGGAWDAIDSGVYEVKLRGSQVRDTTGLASQERVLGTFRVQIDDPNLFIVNSTIDSILDHVDLTTGQPVDADGRTTLRAAIMEANALAGEQTILLPEATYLLAIAGAIEDAAAMGDLDVTDDLSLVGSAPTSTAPPVTVIDARQLDRVLDISAAAHVNITGVTISGGYANTGGGIRNFGTLTISDSRITGNTSQSGGGGIENHSGEVNQYLLTLRRTWVDHNQTTETGELGGGGLYNDGGVRIESSTFSSNSTAAGITGNSGGGAIHNLGTGALDVQNSTISGNTAPKGNGGGIYNVGLVEAVSATITDNSAPAGVGGGIFTEPGGSAPVKFESKFAANGPAHDEFDDIRAIAIDAQGNEYLADNTTSTIRVFDAAGGFKFSFGGFGYEPGQLRRPVAVAVDTTGKIYVADQQVQAFGPDGKYLFTLAEPFLVGATAGENITPGGIAVGPMNQLYLYRRGLTEAKIYVYAADGTFVRAINAPQMFVRGLAVDAQERIYLVATQAPGQVLDPNGALIRTFGDAAIDDPTKIYNPGGVALGPTGDIYVAETHNSSIQVYGQSGSLLRHLAGDFPTSIAVDGSGVIHIFAAAGEQVKAYSSDFTLLSKFGRADNKAYQRGIAIDAQSRTVLADMDGNRIQIYRPDHTLETEFGTAGSGDGQFNAPAAVAVDSQGNIFVADTLNRRLQMFDRQGNFQRVIGEGQLTPEGIVVSPDDQLFVSDSAGDKIFVFSKAGALVSSFGGRGSSDGKFMHPRGLAFDSGGELLVADSDNHRVQVLEADGTFITAITNFGTLPENPSPFDVATSPNGQILVVDYANNLIHAFDPASVQVDPPVFSFGGPGRANGQFLAPSGVETDDSGRIYVAERGSDRIQVFVPDTARRLVFLGNTIVAGNSAVTDPDFRGTLNSDGNNLVGVTDVGFNVTDGGFVATTDPTSIIGTTAEPVLAKLAPLEATHGFIPVHVPMVDSPAVDAGSEVLPVDEVGTLRAADGNGDGEPTSDIGAVERFDSEIRGFLFDDTNGDGIHQVTEPGLAGWRVFIDLNFNGDLDAGEPQTVTSADDRSTPLVVESGQYAFINPPGFYRITVIPPGSYEPSSSTFVPPNGPMNIRKVVEIRAPVASLGGDSFAFLGRAVMDGGNVVFSGLQTSNSVVLPGTPVLGGVGKLFYADVHSNVRPVVTILNNPASEFYGNFPESFDTGKVLIQATEFDGTGRLPGLYLSDLSGQVTKTMDVNTPVPDGDGNFTDANIELPRTSSGVVAFATRSASSNDIYKFYVGSSEASLLHVHDLDALQLESAKSLSAQGTTLAFAGYSHSQVASLYKVTAVTGLTVVADNQTTVPGSADRYKEFVTVALDGTQIAFTGITTDGRIGVYVGTNANDLRVVADENTDAPGGFGKFSYFGEVSQDNGLIAFLGIVSGQKGIYCDIDGHVRKLIAVGDSFDGRPVANVALSLDAVSESHIAFTVQFNDGSAAIYVVTINQAAAQGVAVTVGQEVDGVNFAMHPLNGSLGGIVFDDANADGIRSASEPGLGGWSVYLDQNKNGRVDLNEPTQVTDAAGLYRFDDLASDQGYRVGLVGQSGYAPTSPAESPGFKSIFVGAGQNVTSGSLGVKQVPVSVGISTEGKIQGRVFQDRNGNGKQDSGEAGLPNWTVYIDTNGNHNPDTGELSAPTGADGSYQFGKLANNGGYPVRVVLQGNAQQTTPRENSFVEGNLLLGVTPQDVLVQDFNNDGAPDVAVANGPTNQVQLLLNAKTADQPTGTGRFTAKTAVSRLNNPIRLAQGKFDNDDLPDLVVANKYLDNLTLLLQKNGTATGFASPISIPVGSYQQDLLVTKLDNNGSDDIAVLLRQVGDSPKGEVVLLRSLGNGSFMAPVTIDVGTHPNAITAEDLDADGDQDLIVANTDDKTLQILRNDGDNFVALPPISLAEKPYFIAVADVSGDTNPDLIIANFDKNTLTLLPHAADVHSIAFTTPQTLGANPGPQSITAVDIDNDQDLDLLIADGSTKNVTLLRNRGQGVFAAPESVGIAVITGTAARALAVDDLNSDGVPDVVVARGDSNKLLTGELAGSVSLFTNQLADGANRAAVPTGTETVPGVNFGISNFSPATNSIDPADVDSSGSVNVLDAQLIVGVLRSLRGKPAPIPLPTDNPKLYYDVNADGIVTAADAQAVITAVTARRRAAKALAQSAHLQAAANDKLLNLLSQDVAQQKPSA